LRIVEVVDDTLIFLVKDTYDSIGLACDCHPKWQFYCILEFGKQITPKYEIWDQLRANIYSDDSYLPEHLQIKEWNMHDTDKCSDRNDVDTCSEIDTSDDTDSDFNESPYMTDMENMMKSWHLMIADIIDETSQ